MIRKPVTVDHETRDLSGKTVIDVVARFDTINDAEAYLGAGGVEGFLNADDLYEGRYGINTPHGVGSDVEAISVAKSLNLPHATAKEALLALSKVEP